jgi:hypothetical protein
MPDKVQTERLGTLDAAQRARCTFNAAKRRWFLFAAVFS